MLGELEAERSPMAFEVLFFLLIDGYSIDVEWFRPGKAAAMLAVFCCLGCCCLCLTRRFEMFDRTKL